MGQNMILCKTCERLIILAVLCPAQLLDLLRWHPSDPNSVHRPLEAGDVWRSDGCRLPRQEGVQRELPLSAQ